MVRVVVSSATWLAVWFAVWLGLCLIACPASAQPVQVAIKGCEGLDEQELLRLLAIELSAVQPADSAIAAPTVDVHCQGGWVRLTLVDRDSGGYLDRVIPAPAADDPGRERVVALAASQLVLAWLPREATSASASRPQPEPEPAPAPEPVPEPGPTSQSPEIADVELVAPASSWEGDIVVALRGGARLADLLDQPLPMATAGVAAGWGFAARWSLVVAGEVATGQASRSVGSVRVQTAQGGLGAALLLLRRRTLALELEALLSARYVRLSGELGSALSEIDAARAWARQGIGFEGTLSFGPSLDLGPTRLGIKLRSGVTAGGPLGRVSSDDPVGRAGPFVGLGLELGARLRD